MDQSNQSLLDKKARLAAYQKKWKAANLDKVRATARALVDSGENARRCREWRAANLEKARAADRARAPARKEQLLDTRRRWGKNNRVKRLVEVRRRQALRLSLTCSCCAPWSFKFIYAQARALGMHVDHVKPLARGGSHCLRNMVLLAPLDNLRKGAKYPAAPATARTQ
jgi:5-methylcytosine-specific restriction endonuclease McrA